MTENKVRFLKLVSDEKTDTVERAKERIAKSKPTKPTLPPMRYTDPAYIMAQRRKQNIRKIKAFFKNTKLWM